MAKNYPLYLIVIVILLGIWSIPAGAAPGDPGDDDLCPANTYQMGEAHATLPSMEFCGNRPSNEMTILNDNANFYPCDQYINVYNSSNPLIGAGVFAYPYYNWFENEHDIEGQFLAWFTESAGWAQDDYDDYAFVIYVYSQTDGRFLDSVTVTLGDQEKITASYVIVSSGFSMRYYYNVFVVRWSITIPASAYGEEVYYMFRLVIPQGDTPDVYRVANFQAVPASIFPLTTYCSIPGTNLPYTPTPTIPPTNTPITTLTPQPTNTPRPTLRPTSPAGTTVPTRTATPYVFLTMLPPRPSATPIPINTWAPIQIPTLPTIAPITTSSVQTVLTVESIATTRESEYTEMFAYTTDLATRWAEPVNESIQTLEITGTTGFSSTVETIDAGLEYASYPFRFLRSLSIYTPNTWPFWLVMISGFALYVLTKALRFAVTIIVTLIEWIRRLWEAIPLN